MHLSLLDIIIFAGYFIGIILIGVIVAAKEKNKSADSFFFASKKLPWYTVGASFIAANISTEHFIGMIGWSFLYGMGVCHWSWLNGVTFSLLIWVFLPFYMRGNVSTMPEFLERRYNKPCRYIYAVVSLIGMVIAMLGGVMYAGGKAINVFFPQIPVPLGIIILAVAAGIYTIYGGLLSGAWADFVQYCLLMIAGFVVLFFGLYYVGGWVELVNDLPEKFIMFYPPTHEAIPWTGICSAVFTVGIWYSCANQWMVQRCLGARSEWDARMGIVMSGFSQAILPLIIVVPGLIAFYIFHGQISDPDQSWPYMVNQFLPKGLIGLVLAGLTSAVMSTLSAITTSSSTIISMDIYKTIFRPNAADKEMHNVGRISGAIVMLIGMVLALIMASYSGITVFGLIQTVFFYMAGPISAIFLIGIIWRGATSKGGLIALICGFFIYLPLIVLVLFPKIKVLQPYNNFMHHTFVVWALTAITLIVVSMITERKTKEQLEGVIWNKTAFEFHDSVKGKHHGRFSLLYWWLAMIALITILYTYTTLIGSSSHQYEAEKLHFITTKENQARIQERNEITLTDKSFNLWTNQSQVLFRPSEKGDSITFNIPLDKPGKYQIGAIVTRGPNYGKFSASINEQPAEIKYFITTSDSHKKYNIDNRETTIYDALLKSDNESSETGEYSIAATHVVQRIDLGVFEFTEKNGKVTFISQSSENTNSLVGIDQIAVTRISP